MKRLLFIFGFFICCFSFTGAAQNKELHPAQECVVKFFDAMAAIDTDLMETLVTPDFQLLEDGEVWNLEIIKGYMDQLKNLDFKRINHLSFISIKGDEQVKWVAYHNKADITVNGQQMQMNWLESAVLQNINGRWKIQLLHATEKKKVQ